MGELCLELAHSGCQCSRAVPLGECPETMKMSAQGIVDRGWWDEQIIRPVEKVETKRWHPHPFTFSQGEGAVLRTVIQPIERDTEHCRSNFHLAAPYDFSLSVISRLGRAALLFQKSGEQALAAFMFRHVCKISSRM